MGFRRGRVKFALALWVLSVGLCGLARAQSADAEESRPTRQGDYVAKDFHFLSGETMPALKLHYATLGSPHRNAAGQVDNAVLLLHATGDAGDQFLAPRFAGVLFGPGQLLDIAKFYIILPDDIGHGGSSKPSDGLRARFPKYDYDDMVAAQHLVVMDALHVDHLRLVLGTSMGCMQTFVWGETYPGFSDALMPLACLPVQIAGRNRIIRKMAMDAIRDDPAWKGGDYTAQPPGLKTAVEVKLIMVSSPLRMQKTAPTAELADAYLKRAGSKGVAAADANDFLYQFDASRNYDPSRKLDRIAGPMMWVNSADDFLDPAELGIAPKMAAQMKRAQFVLLPISDATRGHGTHTEAAVWQEYLKQLLEESAPKP